MKRLVLALLLFVAGCGSVPFRETPAVPTVQKSAAELAAGLWTKGRDTLLLRQSALFELRGMKVPLDGIMKLDPVRKTARLVGMNDLGVKLYDISVDREKTTPHSIIPDLAKYPGFADAVGTSVRRIFLSPEPLPSDRLKTGSDSYELTRSEGDKMLRFLLGGPEAQLLEKSSKGGGESWRVRYYQYERLQGIPVPTGIVLDDSEAGYRLTLWIESVEKTDE
ncbi:DUF3261 domain-containing protein [Geomonas sp. RF6]|uniref:DUF3261 domain-containing protein n=1 Tax=Geomonas sp. RF6 TaxID=2897342 RepID=UPI001E32EF98|nr:DUF3261 domain-containing protein [Geomonas sp. RF6]UFS69365.1 DUF3261 domain-containing protein [Geomonas sp. RF6]